MRSSKIQTKQDSGNEARVGVRAPLTDSQEQSRRKALLERLDSLRERLRSSEHGDSHDAFMLYEQIRYFNSSAHSPKLPGEHELMSLEKRVDDVVQHGRIIYPGPHPK